MPPAYRSSRRLVAGLLLLLLPAGSLSGEPDGDPSSRDLRAVARAREGALGLPPPPAPGAETTPARVRLGRKLFVDRRLSRNGTMSCAMCHVPEQGFTSQEMRTAVGLEGRSLARNTPTLLNVAWSAPFFHDGRAPDLELQPFDVLLNPDEMGLPSLGAVVARIRSLPEYPPLFEEAFGGPVTVATIGTAFGAYMRTLVAGASPFDRWRYGGDRRAVSAAAVRGFEVFQSAGCTSCHGVGNENALFSDGAFHDTGIGFRSHETARKSLRVDVQLAPGMLVEVDRSLLRLVGDPVPPDPGRQAITGDPRDRWKFKTPSLRNVAITAPYMHDGSLSSLEQVVEYYAAGGASHPGLDPRLRPLPLSAEDRRDLVTFLESLTGEGIEELVNDLRSEPVGNKPAPGHPRPEG